MENEEKNNQDNIEEFQEEQIDSLESVENFEKPLEAEEAIEEKSFEEAIEADENIELKQEEAEKKDEIEDEFSFLDTLDDSSSKEEPIQEEQKIEPIPTENIVTFEDDVEDIEDSKSEELITVRPVKFQQFELTPPNRTIKKNLDIMQDVSMHISVELGRTKSSIREVMEMEQGSVVELDKIAGEQVEIFVNNKLVAKGEVIVIEDKFGVRITSTNIQKQP